MGLASIIRYAGSGAALSAAVALVFATAAPDAEGQASFLQNGEAGFVVSSIAYALSEDASQTGACPNGMTVGGLSGFDQQRQGQQDQAPSQEQIQRYFQQMLANADTNPCLHPETTQPDPNFRTVEAPNLRAFGIDLDGQDSRASGPAAANTCSHDDFRGMNGERGIDNQFFRVVGCSASFQSTGQSNGWETEMLTGAWGILITLKGVDDIRNDNDVEVGFYANADPIELSPTREPLWNATYAMTQNPRFRAVTHGRLVNGVLTTDPVDVRFWKITNSIWLERVLQDARVRMTLSADGVLDGYLAGYTPVEAMYDLQFGFRNGTDGAGEPAPLQLRLISSNGAAAVLGYTCNGVYHALVAAADGHRDPATGRCSSISTQYHIRAIPAFVVDTATSSTNATLGPPAQSTTY